MAVRESRGGRTREVACADSRAHAGICYNKVHMSVKGGIDDKAAAHL